MAVAVAVVLAFSMVHHRGTRRVGASRVEEKAVWLAMGLMTTSHSLSDEIVSWKTPWVGNGSSRCQVMWVGTSKARSGHTLPLRSWPSTHQEYRPEAEVGAVQLVVARVRMQVRVLVRVPKLVFLAAHSLLAVDKSPWPRWSCRLRSLSTLATLHVPAPQEPFAPADHRPHLDLALQATVAPTTKKLRQPTVQLQLPLQLQLQQQPVSCHLLWASA